MSSASENAQTPTLPEADVEDLRAAVNEAAKHATTRFTTFLFITAYLAVAVASTTDEDLLRESPLKLPLLGIGLPLVPFYIVMPWIYLILHGYLLFQLLLLSRKVEALLHRLPDRRALERQRELLFPFPTLHLLAGADMAGKVKGMALHLLNATNLLIPLLILLGMLWQFLPYHHAWAHSVQRMAIVADLAILWLMWPAIARSRKRAAGFYTEGPYAKLFRHLSEGLICRSKATRYRLVALVLRMTDVGLNLIPKTRRPKTFCLIGSLLAVFVAFGVLVVPMSPLDRFVPTCVVVQTETAVWKWRFGGLTIYRSPSGVEGNWLEPWLHRNLVLRGKTLVAQPPPPQVLARYVRPSDGGESYQFDEKRAWMEHATGLDLSGRNLRGADFTGARLYNVKLHPRGLTQDTEITLLRLHEPERYARLRTDLTSAVLTGAVLSGADLRGARMRDAMLIQSNLDGADLRWAELHGADLLWAELHGANLRGAELHGANLKLAKLHGADLSSAELHGANLTFAELYGADLTQAKLHGANLTLAALHGADLSYAELRGAQLFMAKLHGADLSHAELHGANLTQAKLNGARLHEAELVGVAAFGAYFIGVSVPVVMRTSDVRSIKFSDASSDKDWSKIKENVLAAARDLNHRKHLLDRMEHAHQRIVHFPKELETRLRLETFGGSPPANWNARTSNAELAHDRAVSLADLAADDPWILKEMAMRAERYHLFVDEDPRLALALASELLARHKKNANPANNALTKSELGNLRQIVADPKLTEEIARLDALRSASQPTATQPTATRTQPAPASRPTPS